MVGEICADFGELSLVASIASFDVSFLALLVVSRYGCDGLRRGYPAIGDAPR